MSRLSLAQQIAQLEDAAPREFDAEDDYHHPQNDSSADEGDVEEKLHAGRSHYLDVGPSAIRNAQGSLVEPKYEGMRISRKDVFDGEEVEEDDELVPDASHLGSEVEEDEDGRNESEASEEEDASQPDGDSPPTPKDDAPSLSFEQVVDLASTLQKSRNQDRLKGQAISKQLSLWDALMNARIRLQKGLVAANRLPNPNLISAYTSSDKGKEAADSFLVEALRLSHDLLDLQVALFEKQDIQIPPAKRRKLNLNKGDGRNFAEEVILTSEDFANLEASAHPHHLAIITKWSNKIQAVSPATLLPSKKSSFRLSGQQSTTKTAVELIQESIEGAIGRSKAIGRTRVRRTNGRRIGDVRMDGEDQTRDAEDGDAEIFDDADFYQEMVRDVINTKTGKDDFIPDDWERRKAKKAKKLVDTKASKGRKLRYETHEKLQNFMVPVEPRGLWHEEQMDELFASLVGKGVTVGGDSEMDLGGEAMDPRNGDGRVVEEIDLKGLTVF